MRLAEKYFLNLIRAHAMFDFDFIYQSIFPDDLIDLHYIRPNLILGKGPENCWPSRSLLGWVLLRTYSYLMRAA